MARTKATPVGARGGKQPRKSLLKAKKAASAVGSDAAVRKPHRYRPGTVALRELQSQQGERGTKNALPRAAFERLVREVAQEFRNDVRFTSVAIGALQGAAETYMVDVFKQAMTLQIAGSTRARRNRKTGTIEFAQGDARKCLSLAALRGVRLQADLANPAAPLADARAGYDLGLLRPMSWGEFKTNRRLLRKGYAAVDPTTKRVVLTDAGKKHGATITDSGAAAIRAPKRTAAPATASREKPAAAAAPAAAAPAPAAAAAAAADDAAADDGMEALTA